MAGTVTGCTTSLDECFPFWNARNMFLKDCTPFWRERWLNLRLTRLNARCSSWVHHVFSDLDVPQSLSVCSSQLTCTKISNDITMGDKLEKISLFYFQLKNAWYLRTERQVWKPLTPPVLNLKIARQVSKFEHPRSCWTPKWRVLAFSKFTVYGILHVWLI